MRYDLCGTLLHFNRLTGWYSVCSLCKKTDGNRIRKKTKKWWWRGDWGGRGRFKIVGWTFVDIKLIRKHVPICAKIIFYLFQYFDKSIYYFICKCKLLELGIIQYFLIEIDIINACINKVQNTRPDKISHSEFTFGDNKACTHSWSKNSCSRPLLMLMQTLLPRARIRI